MVSSQERKLAPESEVTPKLRHDAMRSRNLVYVVSLSVVVLLIFAGAGAYYSLKKIEKSTKSEVQYALESVLQATHSALTIWVDDLRNYVRQYADDPAIVLSVERLLQVERTPGALLDSEPLRTLRLKYYQREALSGLGFLVIAPDMTSIGSLRDRNVGTKNVIAELRPGLLERVFKGETVLVPPIVSDVATSIRKGNESIAYTMFIATPVINANGEVIAALAIRIDPVATFSKLIGLGTAKREHRTYAFDQSGVPIGLRVDSRPTVHLSEASLHISTWLDSSSLSNNPFHVDMESYINSRGDKVFGAHLWNSDLGLGLATEINEAVATAPYISARNVTIALFMSIALLGGAIFFGVVSMIRRSNEQLRLYNEALEFKVDQRTHELQLANVELERQQEHLDAMISAIPDAILVVNGKGEVVNANDQVEELLGYKRADLLGELIEKLIPGRYREEHVDIRNSVIGQGKKKLAPNRTLYALDKNGEEIPVEININSFEVGGQWVGVAGLRDIRERVRAEQEKEQLKDQLAHSKKMETVGQLAGGIAHDFNNLLTSIIGFSELALMNLSEEDKTNQDYLNTVRESGERARELVKQLLAFSRGSEGETQVIQVAPILNDALKMLRAAVTKSIEMNLYIEDSECAVEADPTQVHQMIMNLVINARDAMRGTGRIDIGVNRVTLSSALCNSCGSSLSGSFVEIYVEDNGPGISPDIVNKVFDPFYTTKDLSEGTGMGLSIVHGLVHGSGGHIVLESKQGEGATVRLLFPEAISLQQPVIEKPLAREKSVDHQGHILVVDDERSITAFLSELLTTWGYEVTAFNSPLEVIESFEGGRVHYDMVITDQAMPGMQGSELAKIILSLSPETPIVLCSGYSEGVDENSSKRMGITAFLSKPLDTSLLRTTLESAL